MTYAPGGGLPVGLAYTLSALVAFAFMLLPGLGFAFGVGRRARWSWPTILGASFAFGLTVVAAVSLAAHYARLSLTFVLVACALVFVASAVVGVRLRTDAPLPRLGWPGLVLGVAGAAAAVIEQPWFAPADTFYHLAGIRSLLVLDRPVVTDPFCRTSINAVDPTCGAWHTALALVSKSTGLDPIWLWPGATAVGAGMTLLGLWALCRVVSRSDIAATTATLGFFVLTLYLDVRLFAYPNKMSLALMFIALAGAVALIDDGRDRLAEGGLVVVAALAGMSLHLSPATALIAILLFLGAMVLANVLVQRRRTGTWEWGSLLALAVTGAVLLATSLPLLLPKVAVVVSSRIVGYHGGFETQVRHWPFGLLSARRGMIGVGGWVLTIAGLLGALAAVVAFVRDDRRALGAAAIVTFPWVVLLNPLVATPLLARSIYLTGRLAIMLPFTTSVAVAWGLGRLRPRVTRTWLPAGLAALVLAAALQLGYYPIVFRFASVRWHGVVGFGAIPPKDVRLRWGPQVVAQIAREVGARYPIVASEGETAYELAGVLPVALAAPPEKHVFLALESIDGAARRAEVAKLFDITQPEPVHRDVLTRRAIDYVLIDHTDAWDTGSAGERTELLLAELRSETDLFSVVVDSPTLVLFKVRR